MTSMSSGQPSRIPQWTLADRMGKSLKTAGMSVHDMCDYLSVSRNTISAWINGRTPPSVQTVRLWALRTGVPYEWLTEGKEPEDDPDGGSGLRIISPDDPTPPQQKAQVLTARVVSLPRRPITRKAG